MRAVAYFRPALEAGAAGGSPARPENALDAIERYCHENFHQLVRVVEASGAGGRYGELISLFRGAPRSAALVLIPDSAHLAEDLPTLVERLIELDGVGGEVRCVDPEMGDPLGSGLACLGMRGLSGQRVRRVRDAIGAKAVRGEVLGRTPYGYAAGLDGRLTPDAREAEVVRRIFEWYAGGGGGGGEGPGLRRIASRLNADGVRTRSGNPWTPVAVAGVVRNRVYVGTYSRLGVRLAGSHEGLVDRELFNRAQEVLRARRPRRRRGRPVRYLLGGLLRCGVCGRGVFGLTRRRTWRRKDGTEVTRAYRYYECPARAAAGAGGAGEEHPSWRAEPLEQAVLARVAEWARAVPRGAMVAAGDPARAQQRLRGVERQFMRAVREVASGAGIVADLAGSLRRLRRVQSESAAGPGQLEVSAAVADALGAEGDVAAEAMRALVDRVVVRGGSVEVVMRGWSVPEGSPPA